MKGLALAEQYCAEIGLPMIAGKFPGYRNRIAAGLVGEGSECFGFDDDISRDHDWGPSFCIWLAREVHREIGPALQHELNRLPKEFQGIPARAESSWGAGRTGVFEIGQFYRRFIGIDRVPVGLSEWRGIPEGNLAVATNGRVFVDPVGEFTLFREGLQAFYPEDIRLKKIASRCMTMAQAGQYNYLRSARRGEYLAAEHAKSRFAADAISMVFLLNRRYRPFYKWMHRAMADLPVLGTAVYDLLARLFDHAVQTSCARQSEYIEQVCQLVIAELRRAGLSDSTSDFLLDHGPRVQLLIEDPTLRNSNVWLE